MTKLFLSSTAALAFALSATVAYAQDSDLSDPDKTHSEAVMEAAEDTLEAAEDTMEAAEALEEAPTEPAYDEWGNPLEIEADVDTTEQMETDSMNTETVTVTCPEGTEVQSDGSCMVVGDWKTEDAEEVPQ